MKAQKLSISKRVPRKRVGGKHAPFDTIKQIIQLSQDGYTQLAIQKITGVNTKSIKDYVAYFKTHSFEDLVDMFEPASKVCSGECGLEKLIDQFNFVSRGKSDRRRGDCRECQRNDSRKRYHKDPIGNRTKARERRAKDPERHRASAKRTRLKHKDKNNARARNQRKNNPIWSLDKDILSAVNHTLSDTWFYRTNIKIQQIASGFYDEIGYTTQDLTQHIEDLFSAPENLINGKPWMTWDNRGLYRRETWKDDDITTWTWQLDHIIPRSLLPFASLKESNFHKVWALSNLRPYNAKQNCLDGAHRVRHIITDLDKQAKH